MNTDTQLNAPIPATSTEVDLNGQSSFVTIVNMSPSTTLYFSTSSPCTTAKFPIMPNSSYSWSGRAINKFWIIGSAASGNYGVSAH